VLGGILQQVLNISLSVSLIEKNVLASIPPLSYVMCNSQYNRSRDSWHAAILLAASLTSNQIMGCVPIFTIFTSPFSTPKQAKTLPMPGDDCLRFDKDESRSPVRPETREQNPEEAV
jgi:hypothetical protein